MRKEYLSLAVNELKRGRLLWLLEQSWKYISANPSYHLGYPLSGPILGALLVTFRCNNSCHMCDYPARASQKSARGLSELKTEQLRKVIMDFQAIGTSGLGFSGGEPTVRHDIIELLALSVKSGMVTNINTNGNLLAKREFAGRLLDTGLQLINLSVDGATAETHDYLRQAPGGFDKLMQAIDILLETRTRRGYTTRINTVTVLGRENINEAEDIIRLAQSKGVDDIGFMPMHLYGFQNTSAARSVGSGNFIAQAEAAVARIKQARAQSPIDSSDRYLDLFIKCFKGEPSPLRCLAGVQSLMVDCYGRIYPCFPYIEEGKAVGSVLDTSLQNFWKSKDYRRQRQEIAQCRACYWNCHTEMNLLFN